MGLRIDYAFMGESAVHATRTVQRMNGKRRVTFTDPRQELPTQVYDPMSPYLSIAERETYWDRGFFPRLIIDGKPGGPSIRIEEHPLTQEEIYEYRKSRQSHGLEEFKARLDAHADAVIKRRKEEGYYE
jgi:hypothetical protein